ncbi:GAF domain-containing protein [Lusitaniella coriacea LEGE 07157]|uniref:GAF domain-containing protein n=1 Tax=Lusitaniella coriacea LEGE 07157 TaxID=945747 RepID=A0A8J7DNZ4_9CYAN|nr:GAF domain-containing protein [Lusitaniella coriacea]MBE9115404.1 GAF domain-containing protein [Lusitaniella coriacea LEGE 07157]
MGNRSSEQQIAKFESLRREVEELTTFKIAYEAQDELVRAFISMGRTSATSQLMLKSMLLQAAKMASKLSQAEDCSLFLVNSDNVVTDSVLARGATIREQKESLIDRVLDKGIAGWVVRNRQVGLIADTMQDSRWLNLPNQPYTVRSALCVPILRGRTLLGVLTLTHSQPNQFDKRTAHLMQMCATQMTLALDNVRLYRQDQEHLPATPSPAESLPVETVRESLSEIGIYIINDRGKFVYANPRFLKIFDYKISQLAELQSVLALVQSQDRDRVAQEIEHCLNGHLSHLSCEFKGKMSTGEVLEIEISGTRTKFYGKYSIIGTVRLLNHS